MGTRGRPFRERFFSGMVGRSQFPAFGAVLENGRIETFFDGLLDDWDDWDERRALRGRTGEVERVRCEN